MLPSLTIYLKPMSLSPPADRFCTSPTLFVVSYPSWQVIPSSPLVIMSSLPQPCHNSSPPHTFQSGYGVSFTPNPALWLGPMKSASQSDKHTLALSCLCCINTVISPALTSPFYALFFQLWQRCVCHQRGSSVTPLIDLIAGLRLRWFEWWAHMKQTKKKWMPPLMPLWYVHKETLKVSQCSGTGIPNKIVSALSASESRLQLYWPGMWWTLSLEGGKSDSSSRRTIKNHQWALTV